MPVLKIHVVFPDHQIQRQWNSKQCVTNATICNMLLCGCVPVCEFWMKGCMCGSQDHLGSQVSPSTTFKAGFSFVCHRVHPAGLWDSISISHLTMEMLGLQVWPSMSPWECLDCRCDLLFHHGSTWMAGVTSHLTMGVLGLQVCAVLSGLTGVLGIQTKALMTSLLCHLSATVSFRGVKKCKEEIQFIEFKCCIVLVLYSTCLFKTFFPYNFYSTSSLWFFL